MIFHIELTLSQFCPENSNWVNTGQKYPGHFSCDAVPLRGEMWPIYLRKTALTKATAAYYTGPVARVCTVMYNRTFLLGQV